MWGQYLSTCVIGTPPTLSGGGEKRAQRLGSLISNTNIGHSWNSFN